MELSTIQLLFNLIASIAGFAFVIILHRIFKALDGLRTADEQMGRDLRHLEVKLPTDYVHKQEFQHLIDAIFTKLDRIEQKIDGKLDKNSNG